MIVMYVSKAGRLTAIQELPPEHRLHRCVILDVSQNAHYGRGCGADGSLPTFLRNTKFWHKTLHRFLSPKQMMRIMGWPMTDADKEAAALRCSWPTLRAKKGTLRNMAGDAVNFHCIAAVFVVALIFTEPLV